MDTDPVIRAHPSHDFGETGYCHGCTVYCMALEARFRCNPTTAEPETDAPPAIDWSGVVEL